MWVIPEILGKRAMVYLNSTLSMQFDDLLGAALIFKVHMRCCSAALASLGGEGSERMAEDLICNDFEKLITIEDLGRVKDLTLHEALRHCYRRETSDRRDMVHALLSVVKPEERVVEPDYEVDVAEVYKRTTFNIIRKTGDLAVFMDI